MIYRLFGLISLLFFFSCATDNQQGNGEDLAEQWINKAIEAHGSDALENSEVLFTFRGADFLVKKEGHDFYYQRQQIDTSGQRIIDQVWPDSTYRTIDGERELLTPKKSDAISESIHSVVYFAFLPQALKDPAVQSSYIDQTKVKGQSYHRIKVTFDEKNGGEDHEDEYLYWIHDTKHTLDYLAYNFQVNGGGARFRVAENPRDISDVRFQDYKNYKPVDDSKGLMRLDSLYEKGDLELVSEIKLRNIEVAIVKD